MKTFKITKEQILEVTSWGDTTDKKNIKKWFPEAFKTELEVGKWYWAGEIAKREKTHLYCHQGYISYGFDWAKNYINDLCTSGSSEIIEATEEEVKTALTEEAKRRGFIQGVKVKCAKYPDFDAYDFKEITFDNVNQLGNATLNYIFYNGKWAEIIPQEVELTLEQIADKFNIDVKQLKIKK